MPYARKYALKIQKKRRPVIRLKRKPMRTANRYRRLDRIASKRLNNGLQWKQTLYGGNQVLQVGSLNTLFTYTNMIADIPKYRADPTATDPMANLQIARTSDKLFLKGFKVNLSITNFSTQTTMIRFFLFRNNSWEETFLNDGSNLIESLAGNSTTYSTLMSTAMTERFNTDLVRNKRRDLLFDRRVIVASVNSTEAKNATYRSFYVKCNHICQFESKGTTAQGDDLKTGKYIFCAFISNPTNGDSGTTAFHWDINAVWAQA